LGFVVARILRDCGAPVIINGRTETVPRAKEDLGENVDYLVHDALHRRDTAPVLLEQSLATGPVIIVVNNAGIHSKKPFVEMHFDEFQRP
jgi:gluconate 5-dehydrogenase